VISEKEDNKPRQAFIKTKGIGDIFFVLPVLLLFLIRDFGNFGKIRSADLDYIRYLLHPENFVHDQTWFVIIDTPYVYFHKIIAFVIEVLHLENNMTVVFATLQFMAILLLLIALKKLCDFVFQNYLATILFIILFMFLEAPSLLGSNPPSSFCALTLARVFLVFSLLYFLRKNFWLAGLLAGIATNIHFGGTVWLMAAYTIYFVLNWKRLRLPQLAMFYLLFTAASLPTSIGLFLSPALESLPWADILFKHLSFPQTSAVLTFVNRPETIIVALIGIILAIIAYFRAKAADHENNRNLLLLAAAAIIVFGIHEIMVDFFFIGLVAKAMFYRVVWYLYLIEALYIANLLRIRFEQKQYIFFMILLLILQPTELVFLVIIGFELIRLIVKTFHIKFDKWSLFELLIVEAIIFGIILLGVKFSTLNEIYLPFLLVMPVLPVLYYLLISKDLTRKRLLSPVSMVIISIIIFGFAINGLSSVRPVPEQLAWQDVITYANEHTEQDTKIIYPLDKYDFYNWSERSGFFSYYYPVTLLSSNKYADEMLKISNDVNIDLKRVTPETGQVYRSEWKQAWESIDKDTISKWINRYQLRYMIRESNLPIDFPIVYKNSFYTLYRLTN